MIASLVLLGSTGITLAQNVNKKTTTEVTTATTTSGKKMNMYVIKDEVQKVKLSKDDLTELNQNTIETPVEVDKIILIDNDQDASYDRMVEIDYYKEANEEIMVMPADEGVMLVSGTGDSVNVDSSGLYTIDIKKGTIVLYVKRFNSLQ